MNESYYNPDRWVVLEVTDPYTKITIKKVFAGWYGGYLGSDSWKLSSGITKTVEHKDRYDFHNISGSIYGCHKKAVGMGGYMTDVLNDWHNRIKEAGENPDMIVLTENFDPVGIDN